MVATARKINIITTTTYGLTKNKYLTKAD